MHIELLSNELKEREVGYKAYQLSRVYRTFNVPPGVILTTQNFLQFMSQIKQKIDSLLNDLPLHDEEKFQNIANEIQRTIMEHPFSDEMKSDIIEFYHSLSIGNSIGDNKSNANVNSLISHQDDPLVSVRSSSFVVYENLNFTTLNVRGIESLLNAIKIAWASLYTKKSIHYHLNNNQEFVMGVLIQPMINSELSGRAYFEDTNTIIVEGAYGLGEGIQSEIVQPDVYTITKESLEIKERNIVEQNILLAKDKNQDKTVEYEITTEASRSQKLKDKHIREAALLCKRIMNFLKEPCKIEFCINNDQLYLMQVNQQEIITTYEDVSEQSWPSKLMQKDSQYLGAEDHRYDPSQELFENGEIEVVESSEAESNQFITQPESLVSETLETAENSETSESLETTELDFNITQNIIEQQAQDTNKESNASKQDQNDVSQLPYGAYNVANSGIDEAKEDLSNNNSNNQNNSHNLQENSKESHQLQEIENNLDEELETLEDLEVAEHSEKSEELENSEEADEQESELLNELESLENSNQEISENSISSQENTLNFLDVNLGTSDEEISSEEINNVEMSNEKIDLVNRDESVEEEVFLEDETNNMIDEQNAEAGKELDSGHDYAKQEMLDYSGHFISSCFQLVNKKLREFHNKKTNYSGEISFEQILHDLRDHVQDSESLKELKNIHERVERGEEVQLSEVSVVSQTTQQFMNTFQN